MNCLDAGWRWGRNETDRYGMDRCRHKNIFHQVLVKSNIAELHDRAKVFQLPPSPSPSPSPTKTAIVQWKAPNDTQQIRIGWHYAFILAEKSALAKSKKKN